jgi:ABC-2 type transport system ATP-binding protein
VPITKTEEIAPIKFEGVTKSYGSVDALTGVNMVVETGDIFGFLGPNGAGKTTSIRILVGLIKPRNGSAKVFGLDAWKKSVAIKKRIGFLPDTPGIYDRMTGRQFLDYLARLRGFRRPPPFQKELLDRMELAEIALRRMLKGYSQGMKQKVMLIQSMQHEPDLLIMDEPTDALDPLMRQVFFGVLREFQERGGTVFMSSHVLSDVEAICKRVAIIRNGSIVSVGNMEELKKDYVRSMRVEFKNSPPDSINLPGISITSQKGKTWELSVTGDINPLIQLLASHNINDLVFESPRLEELFLTFYENRVPK